jgi:hypothetical protein
MAVKLGTDAPADGDQGAAAATPAPFGEASGEPTASSWREQALTRIAELEDLADAFGDPDQTRAVLAERIHRHLRTAREAADGSGSRGGWTRLKALVGGSPLERTASNMDAAEADLLRLAPVGYVEGQLPGMLAYVRAHLPFEDPAAGDRVRVRARENRSSQRCGAQRSSSHPCGPRARRPGARSCRSAVFRNILYIAATMLAVAAAGLVEPSGSPSAHWRGF